MARAILLSACFSAWCTAWLYQRFGGQEAVRPRVVCFGDSLTQFGFDTSRQGWLAQLAHWWERRFDVIDRGFSGYNTRWLMPLVDRLFVSKGAAATKLVTIFLGANDSVLPGFFQHVPIAEYKDNLKSMVAHIRKVYPHARLLLITPPPIHEAKWAEDRRKKEQEMDRSLAHTMVYAAACLEVGEQVSVKVVDAFALMGSGSQDLADEHLHDGVHFTAKGNIALFEAVKQEIQASFPELDPERQGRADLQPPYFREIDPVHFAESVLKGL